MPKSKIIQNQYYLWLSTIAFCALQSFPIQAQTVLESIQETGVLRVAVREDAAPFGYLKGDRLHGYCLDFIALLEKKIKQELPRDTMAIRLLKSTTSNRFTLVEQGLIDLECGPNSIRDLSSSKVAFSQAFFVTTTQLLVSQAKAKEIKFNSDLAGVTLGVIRNTTTEQLIKEQYPSANLVLFSGVTARNRGVQAVAQGKIDAIVSDGILLRAEAANENLSIEDYTIIPETPISEANSVFAQSDRYGMIIRGEDKQWRNFVNSVIVSQESQQLFKQWFQFVESFPTE
jgi:polar amino acid transport system substrate-binding protein